LANILLGDASTINSIGLITGTCKNGNHNIIKIKLALMSNIHLYGIQRVKTLTQDSVVGIATSYGLDN
jgi:hypothetical protein